MKFIEASALSFEPASHEDPSDPGVLKKVLATCDHLQKGQVMMVNWAKLPIGKSFAAHYHEDMQEVFVLVEGRASMEIDGESFPLAPGDSIIVDPREIHAMHNEGEQDAHYVVFGISREEGGQTINV